MTKSRHLITPRKRWSPSELELLAQRYPDTKAADLAEEFSCTVSQIYVRAKALKLSKSEAFLKSAASGRLDGVTGSQTRFKAGGTSWNLGRKGIHHSPATEFKKGAVPANVQEVGALRINTAGDIEIKLAPGKRQWLSLRRYQWQLMHGSIPEGMVIHVRDGDPHNTQPENLELITRQENLRRMRERYPKEIMQLMRLNGNLKSRIKKLSTE
jgi:HNH endonuclease